MKNYTINVSFQNGNIDSNFMELVQNDYNSTKLNFIFDTDDRVVMKMLYPDNTTQYITQINNNELLLGPGVLSQDGTYQMELSSYSDTGRLTAYATMEFYVRQELVDTDEIVEPDDRVPVLDNLITEVNNINITMNKVDDVATITLTRKDGTTQTIRLYDGDVGSTGAKGDKGDKGDTGDTGPQGPQGIQGETGDSGVRVSDTEPTDPEVNVWIDTSDDANGGE